MSEDPNKSRARHLRWRAANLGKWKRRTAQKKRYYATTQKNNRRLVNCCPAMNGDPGIGSNVPVCASMLKTERLPEVPAKYWNVPVGSVRSVSAGSTLKGEPGTGVSEPELASMA